MSDNLRSRQLNPQDDLFWKSRGYPERPRNWQELLEDMGYYDDEESDQSDTSSEYETETESESESGGSWESDDEEHRTNSNQNNPNNDEYWRLRGWTERPDDWRDRI